MSRALADRRSHASRLRAWLRSRMAELQLPDVELELRMEARAAKARRMLAGRGIVDAGRVFRFKVEG
jgi:hypothetical protein